MIDVLIVDEAAPVITFVIICLFCQIILERLNLLLDTLLVGVAAPV